MNSPYPAIIGPDAAGNHSAFVTVSIIQFLLSRFMIFVRI